jgi:ABC-type Fe3+ transport system permease subunit
VVEIRISAMTLLRSLIIGGIAVSVARPLCALLIDPRLSRRRLAWVLLLAPYFTPTLLTGYAYANFSLSLIHHPVINLLFYSMLVGLKFTPIAGVIFHFTPAPISAEAIHCRGLMTGSLSTFRSKLDHWIFLLKAGCARGPLAAFAVVFLCAFAEFEMASLMGVKTWTVLLFDANAGGGALSESLQRMLGPLLCEAAAVATVVIVLGRHRIKPAPRRATSTGTSWFAWFYLIMAFVFVQGIPAAMVLWGTVRGFRLLFDNFVLSREIISSLLFASGATLLASVAVFWLGRPANHRGPGSIIAKTILAIGVCIGLLGPLLLSLAILAAMQLPGLLSLRNTPVPLVITLALGLLPLAFVLKRVLDLAGHRSSLHLARLMPKSAPARELKWRLSTSGKFWIVLLLFVLAYWDLTASAILAPIGMTPVTVRLYNLMHYGQIAALSAMTCATFAAPILLFMVALGTRRWWAPQ